MDNIGISRSNTESAVSEIISKIEIELIEEAEKSKNKILASIEKSSGEFIDSLKVNVEREVEIINEMGELLIAIAKYIQSAAVAFEEVDQAYKISKVTVESTPVLAPLGRKIVKAESDFPDMEKESSSKIKGARKDLIEIREEVTERRNIMCKMRYINSYVNEETLREINSQWNTEILQEKYKGEFFEKLRENMYEAGITDRRSILMFLSSLGKECAYGTELTEKYTTDYLKNKSYTANTRGGGLIQVTGETQKNFMQYLCDTLPKGEEKATVENYLDGYEIIQDKDGIEKLDNQYKITVSYINDDGKEAKKDVCVSEFIADNYSIESAVWFWGINEKNVALFDWNEETKRNDIQVDMTINEYIEHFEDANQNNLFLASQYAVNGRQMFYKGDLEYICKSPEDIWKEGDTKVSSDKRDSPLPNGWEERKADWDRANNKFIEETD